MPVHESAGECFEFVTRGLDSKFVTSHRNKGVKEKMNIWNQFLDSDFQNEKLEKWLNSYFGLVASVE